MATPTEVKVSISRPNCGDGREVMCVRVIDAASRLSVVGFEMPLSEFMKCITGQAEIPANVTRFTEETKRQFLGMKKEIRHLECDRVFSKEKQREIVLNEFAKMEPGWHLLSDGTRSQQRGDKHEYIIQRWVD